MALTGSTECYLFLDFDGVLLSQAEQENFVDEFGPAFDPGKIAFIRNLQEITCCKNIITTSWRNRAETGLPAMQRLFRQRQIEMTIHDTVDISLPQKARQTSGELVRLWLNKCGIVQPRYCILDDCGPEFFLKEQIPFLVQTHWSGMTERDYQKALQILQP